MPLYKVYHDGSHYVGIEQGRKLERLPRSNLGETEIHTQCSELYKLALSMDIKSKRRLSGFLVDNLASIYDTAFLSEYVPPFIDRQFQNYNARVKRFRRKAFLHQWNYLCTFTYDSALLSEEAFEKRLLVCLQHLASRRSWKYMGVWERGELGGRLHFHAITYVPPDQMIGALYPERYYDKKTHRMRDAWRNTFFDLKFGRADFSALSENDVRCGPALSYLVKYLQKTGGRIIYSRGIPTELLLNIEECEIALKFEDYVPKVIISEDALWLSPDVLPLDHNEEMLWEDIVDLSPRYPFGRKSAPKNVAKNNTGSIPGDPQRVQPLEELPF